MTDERKNWTEYAFETWEDIVALAQVIAAFMYSDETEPTDGDRSKWLSDVKLRELESKVVQTECQYGKFAELCQLALGSVDDLHMRALCTLGILNGERRKLGDRNDGTVRYTIRVASEMIANLPAGDRKNRLDGLLDYHKGQYATVVGDHDMAAECQHKSAVKAEMAGDIRGLAISAFCEAVERVSVAIVAGDGLIIRWRLQMLKATGLFLKNALSTDGSADAVRWRELNYPCHMITSYFWGCMQTLIANDVGLMFWALNTYVSNPDNVKHKPILVLCNAILSNNCILAEDVWTGKVQGELHPVYKATAGLLLARLAGAQGDSEVAAGYYDAIIKMDGPIHVVRAIATSELNYLQNTYK